MDSILQEDDCQFQQFLLYNLDIDTYGSEYVESLGLHCLRYNLFFQ